VAGHAPALYEQDTDPYRAGACPATVPLVPPWRRRGATLAVALATNDI